MEVGEVEIQRVKQMEPGRQQAGINRCYIQGDGNHTYRVERGHQLNIETFQCSPAKSRCESSVALRV